MRVSKLAQPTRQNINWDIGAHETDDDGFTLMLHCLPKEAKDQRRR